jgi:peptide deformylase
MQNEEKKKEEKIDFTKYLVKPHKKKSGKVTEKDIERVIKDAHILYNLCHTQIGMYPGGFALAHPQIDDKDPLRFFVSREKEIIINPEIIDHTKVTVEKIEGCLSYPDLPPKTVERYNKITVEFKVLTTDGKISEKKTLNLGGKMAQIYQHEMQHFGLLGNKMYIYE